MTFSLKGPIGDGQDNDPEDIANLEDSLIDIGAFTPRVGRPSPLPVITPELDMAVSRYQADRGLKVDGVLKPGGPTERSIKNELEGKPRGAALAVEARQAKSARRRSKGFKLNLKDGVGEGEPNPPADVRRTKQALAALGLLNEDPFDVPSPAIDGEAEHAMKEFQMRSGLKPDAIARSGGPTEQALNRAVTAELIKRAPEFEAYLRRSRTSHHNAGSGGRQQGDSDSAGGVQLAAFNPERSPIVDDTGSGSDGPEPARSLRAKRRRRAPGGSPLGAFPELYIPDAQDMERIGDTFEDVLEFLYGPGYRTTAPKTKQTPSNIEKRGAKQAKTPAVQLPKELPNVPGFGKEDRKNLVPLSVGQARELGANFIVERREKESTRQYNHKLQERLTKLAEKECDGNIEHVAGGSEETDEGRLKDIPEEELPPRHRSGKRKIMKGQRKGGAYPDLIFRNRVTGRSLYINTFTPRNKRLDPILRELKAAIRIVYNAARGDSLVMIPKIEDHEDIDLEKHDKFFRRMLRSLCKPQLPIDPRDKRSPRALFHILKIIPDILLSD